MKPRPAPTPPKKPIGPAYLSSEGYWMIRLNRKTYYLHRLIYEQVYGPIPDGYHVHHLNGDRADCSPKNLKALAPGEHVRVHHLGLHPSHRVLPDGTVVKRCQICGEDRPLKELYSFTTPAGSVSYRPYCRTCFNWTYGWASQRSAAANA